MRLGGLPLLLVFATAGSAATLASSQAAIQTSGPVTLELAWRSALISSETLQTQRELVVQADEHVSQAVGSILPSVTANYGFLQQQAPDNPLSSQFSPATQNTVRVNFSQPLFRGLREYAGLRMRKRQFEGQKEALEQAERQVYQDLAQATYNVLADEEDRRTLEEQLEVNRKRLGDLRSGNASGRFRQAEVLSVEASVANLEAQLEQTLGLLASARETWALASGLPRDSQIADDLTPPAALPPLEDFLKGIEQRPDVRGAIQDLEASEEQVTVSKGAHLPSIDFNANWYPVRPGLLSNITWDLNLAASLPLYAGGALQSQVRESVSQRKTRELALAHARRLADQEIRALYATCQADREQRARLAHAVDVTHRASVLEQSDLRAGRATSVEVLSALDTEVQTHRASDRARFNEKVDWIRLEVAAALLPARGER